MGILEEKLGQMMTSTQVAAYLGVNEKTVREHYKDLGGIRLGRLYRFSEKEVINAIQKREKMGGPSENGWEEEGKSLPRQERSNIMGKRDSIKSRRNLAGEDKHGILV